MAEVQGLLVTSILSDQFRSRMEEAGNDDFGYVWSSIFFLLKRKKYVMWLMWVLRLICAQCLEYQLTFKFGMFFFKPNGEIRRNPTFFGEL